MSSRLSLVHHGASTNLILATVMHPVHNGSPARRLRSTSDHVGQGTFLIQLQSPDDQLAVPVMSFLVRIQADTTKKSEYVGTIRICCNSTLKYGKIGEEHGIFADCYCRQRTAGSCKRPPNWGFDCRIPGSQVQILYLVAGRFSALSKKIETENQRKLLNIGVRTTNLPNIWDLTFGPVDPIRLWARRAQDALLNSWELLYSKWR